jgi:hypothetical protein
LRYQVHLILFHGHLKFWYIHTWVSQRWLLHRAFRAAASWGGISDECSLRQCARTGVFSVFRVGIH